MNAKQLRVVRAHAEKLFRKGKLKPGTIIPWARKAMEKNFLNRIKQGQQRIPRPLFFDRGLLCHSFQLRGRDIEYDVVWAVKKRKRLVLRIKHKCPHWKKAKKEE